jgi:hypothetical protein
MAIFPSALNATCDTEDEMEHWLRCTVRRGQFSGEYVVEGDTADGKGFSLFAEADHVRLEGNSQAQKESKTPGWIRVDVVDQRDGIMLVRLPSEALEIGYFITVRAGDVKPQSDARRLEPA